MTALSALLAVSGLASIGLGATPVAAWASSGVTVAGGNGPGSAANQLTLPQGVALDASGNVYVADTSNNRVQKFPAGSTSLTNGTTVAGGNGAGSAANQLDAPSALILDAKGNLFVADTSNNRVQKFPAGSTSLTNGTTVAGGNGDGSAANQLSGPLALARDGAANLYVADGKNNRVQKFPAASTSLTNATTAAGGNGAGTAANQLQVPAGLAIDGSGNLYVGDSGNNRVQRFPAGSTSLTNGTTAAGGNGAGSAADQLTSPSGLRIGSGGSLYVADTGNHRVQKFPAGSTSASTGLTVAGGNGAGWAANQLTMPTAVAFDGVGNLYVADQRNNRIQKWAGTPEAPEIGFANYLTTTSAVVGFTPGDPGGSPVTGYRTTCVSKTGITRSATGGSSPITITTLVAGEAFSCTVVATNAAGDSDPSRGLPVLETVPGIPGRPSVIRDGFQSVQLRTTAPANNGGNAITVYNFYAVSDKTNFACAAVAPALSCRFTGMEVGRSYSFFVKAANGVGEGMASSSSLATTGVGLGLFSRTSVATTSKYVDLVPVSAAQVGTKVDTGSRILVYLTAGTTSATDPLIAGVSFPFGGGATTCSTSYSAVTGGSATVGTGIRGAVISCVVTTAIVNGAVMRITLTTPTPKAVAMGEWIAGLPSGGTVTTTAAATGVASAPGSSTTVSVPAGKLVVGAIAYENGLLALAADTDTAGGSAWMPAMSTSDGVAGAAGVGVVRQYKWVTAAATHRFNSATSTGAGQNWAGFILTVG